MFKYLTDKSILFLPVIFYLCLNCNFLFCEDTNIISEKESIVIRAVIFKNNKNLTTSYLSSIITAKMGEYTKAEVEDIIENNIFILTKLDYFSDVKVSLDEDGVLIFDVKENPLIKSINLYGANGIKESSDDTETISKLKEAIELHENNILQPALLQKSINNIKELYYSKGFANVEVVPVFDNDTEVNKTNLTLEIIENQKVKIKYVDINFYEKYSGLKEFVKRFITKYKMKQDKGDKYLKQELETDITKMRMKFYNNGYVEARIENSVVFNSDKSKVTITLNIFQGKQYRFGTIELKNNTIFKSEELLKKITLKKNEIYRNDEFMENIEAMKMMYREKGYLDADIDFRYKLTEDGHINYNLVISEGEKYFINKIKVRGNIKTKIKVILREMLVKEGDIFDQNKVELSKRNLVMLNFFDEVKVAIESTDKKNYKDLIIEVAEGRTGTLTFGAGYSSVDKFVGFLEVSKNNFDAKDFWSFTGKGQKVHFKTEFGKKRTNYEFGWEDPWFNDKTSDTSVPSPAKPLFLGYNIYNLKRELDEYDITRVGGNIQVGRRLGLYDRIYFKYQYEHVKINNVNRSLAPIDIIQKVDEQGGEQSKEISSSIDIDYVRNTTDSPKFPTLGYIFDFSNTLSGGILGGDIDFYKPVMDYSYFIPTFRTKIGRHCIAFHIRGAVVKNIFSNKELPDYSRFYLGGASSIRGYSDNDIKLFDIYNSLYSSRGGETELYFNIEYRIPLVKDQIYMVAFYDGGNIDRDAFKMNFNEFKYGFGLGVRIDTPVGKIRLDYGYRLNNTNELSKDAGQSEIHFSIGPMF